MLMAWKGAVSMGEREWRDTRLTRSAVQPLSRKTPSGGRTTATMIWDGVRNALTRVEGGTDLANIGNGECHGGGGELGFYCGLTCDGILRDEQSEE
jgi:hypothetical protein